MSSAALKSSQYTVPTRYARRAAWLEEVYARFHHRTLLGTDPLQVVYRFDKPGDREIIGLIAAGLAYGNVKAILGGIDNVLGRVGPAPRDFLLQHTDDEIADAFAGFRYRVTSAMDMTALLVGMRRMLLRHGSLESAFLHHDGDDEPTIVPALARWVEELLGPSQLRHLVPAPARGSACKRLMLYLRWMVRRDEIDPGGWTSVDPARLVVPLDTHLHRMGRKLRFTRRRDASLKTAMEVTAAFRRICPADPLRYDFALTRPGIMRVRVT